MKTTASAGIGSSVGKNWHGAFKTGFTTALCVTVGLLSACGELGLESSDNGVVASSDVNGSQAEGKSAESRFDGQLDESGKTSATGALSIQSAEQAVTKPAPVAPVATVNSLDTIIDDMRLMNDAELAGVPSNYGWSRGPGYVMMGNDPRGTNTPSWWNVDNARYKSGAYWNAILPWFVIFDGVGHDAGNTRVQVRNMKLYMKSKASGTWKLLEASTGVGGELYPKTLQGTNVSSPDTRTEADGSTSILPPGGNMVFHGWSNGFSEIDGSDIAAVFLTLQARLVKNDEAGVDDRARAKYLIHVGGDYYPDTSTRAYDLAPAYYFPGIGVSRAKMVNDQWQAFNFSTIDVGIEDPGGATLSEAELRAAPPPLE